MEAEEEGEEKTGRAGSGIVMQERREGEVIGGDNKNEI